MRNLITSFLVFLISFGALKAQVKTVMHTDTLLTDVQYDHFSTRFISPITPDSLLIIDTRSKPLLPMYQQWQFLDAQFQLRPDTAQRVASYRVPLHNFIQGNLMAVDRFPGKTSLMVHVYNPPRNRFVSAYRDENYQLKAYSVMDSFRYFSGQPVGYRLVGQYYSLERRTDSSGAYLRNTQQNPKHFLTLRDWQDGQKVRDLAVNVDSLNQVLEQQLTAQSSSGNAWYTHLAHVSGPWLYFSAYQDSTYQEKTLVYHHPQDSLYTTLSGPVSIRYRSDQTLFFHRPAQEKILIVTPPFQVLDTYHYGPEIPGTATPMRHLVWDYDFQKDRMWLLYGGISKSTYVPVADSIHPRGLMAFDGQGHLLHHFALDTLAGYLTAHSLLALNGKVYFSLGDPRGMPKPYSLLGTIDSAFQISLQSLPSTKALQLYPQPATGELKVQLPTAAEGALPYGLHGLTGQMYQRGQLRFSGGEATLDLNELAPGTYFLVLEAGEKRYRARVLVE